MGIYLEEPKELVEILLEMIEEFSKVAKYKIHIRKPIAFL